MAYATVDYVAAKWRTLTTAEQAKCQVLIDEGEALLALALPGLAADVAAGAVDVVIVRKVVSDAVIRVLRNPAGVIQQTVGPESVSWARADASGTVEFTDDELALLVPAEEDDTICADGQVIGAATLGRPSRPHWLRHEIDGSPHRRRAGCR